MEMRIVMSKKEAQQLLEVALKHRLGNVEFTVKDVSWANEVTFELESVEVKNDLLAGWRASPADTPV